MSTDLLGRRGPSRSRGIESLIDVSRRRKREEELAELAREFFARELSPAEREEREDWLKMSLETQKGDR
jgi:hypothetical protein